jgi:hypothetical protein
VIELLLAHDVVATAPNKPSLGVGTAMALRMIEEAISAAEPVADAVHRGLRERLASHAGG